MVLTRQWLVLMKRTGLRDSGAVILALWNIEATREGMPFILLEREDDAK
jgi:hypothetical protein